MSAGNTGLEPHSPGCLKLEVSLLSSGRTGPSCPGLLPSFHVRLAPRQDLGSLRDATHVNESVHFYKRFYD